MAYITLYKVGEGKIIFGVNSAMEKKKKKKLVINTAMLGNEP